MPDNVINVLQEARRKIQSGWCQNHMAQTRTRTTCSPHQSKAARFCIMGALIAAAPSFQDPGREQARLAVLAVLRKRYKKTVILMEFNDHSERTQDEVLELFDEAIAHVSNQE